MHKMVLKTIFITLLLIFPMSFSPFADVYVAAEATSSQTATKIFIQEKEEIKDYWVKTFFFRTSYMPEGLKMPLIEIEEEQITIYDTLSEKEIYLIELTVQHEVGAFSPTYKELIANVILNRFLSSAFPDTIEEVILQEGQFTDGNYDGVEIDEATKEAVKKVFSLEEPIHDATFYYNPDYSSNASIQWFEYSGDVEYLFTYSEDMWGSSWRARFFK